MDRLDYLKRDSFYTGVAEGTINSERLITMLDVNNDNLVVEEKGISLLNSVLVADYGKTMEYVHSIISIVGFMADSGVSHPANNRQDKGVS